MENSIYYYSFVCWNESAASPLQLILSNFERHGNTIISSTKKLLTASKKNETPNTVKLSETINRLEHLNSTRSKESIENLIEKELELVFLQKIINAQNGGYLFDLLDFHLTEYKGKKTDFIEHLKSKRFRDITAISVWIEKQLVNNNNITDINTQVALERSFNNVSTNKPHLSHPEKLIIIELLQSQGLFIKVHSDEITAQVGIDKLISSLTGISSSEEVKRLRNNEVRKIFKADLTDGQFKHKLNNIKNIRPVIEGLKITKLTTALNDLERKIKAGANKFAK